MQGDWYAPGRVLVKLKPAPAAGGVGAQAQDLLPGLDLVQTLGTMGPASGASGARRRLAAASGEAAGLYAITDNATVLQKVRELKDLAGACKQAHASHMK